MPAYVLTQGLPQPALSCCRCRCPPSTQTGRPVLLPCRRCICPPSTPEHKLDGQTMSISTPRAHRDELCSATSAKWLETPPLHTRERTNYWRHATCIMMLQATQTTPPAKTNCISLLTEVLCVHLQHHVSKVNLPVHMLLVTLGNKLRQTGGSAAVT